MNDNRSLLRTVALNLHTPVLEVLNEMGRQNIRVRLKPAEGADPADKKPATAVTVEVWGTQPKGVEPHGILKQVIEEVVVRTNRQRVFQGVTADGTTIKLGERRRRPRRTNR